MKKQCLFFVFFMLVGFLVFGEAEDHEEIDYLLFLPNSSNMFVNEARAMIQLDNMAKHLTGREVAPNHVYVYGYAAFAENNIDPVVLSRDRALFVTNELQKRGVSRSLFSDPVGYGSVNLWGSNINEEDKIPNRRVRVVLDGSILVVAPTGQIRETEIPPPVVVQEPEVIVQEDVVPQEQIEEQIASTDIDPEPVKAKDEKPKDKSKFKFPWWLLLPLLLLPLLFFKLKKKPADKPTKPEKAAPVAAAPPPAAPVEPVAAPIVANEIVEPVAAPAPVVEEVEPVIAPIEPMPAMAESANDATITAPAASEPAPPIAAIPAAAPVVVTSGNAVYIEEEIRRRAYYYYEERHGLNGTREKDWYKALPEICSKYEADGYKTYMEDGCWWARKTFSREV